MKTIAIHPDFVRHKNGKEQSFSDRWISILPSLGGIARVVDFRDPGAIDTISQCDGFMWRFKPSIPERHQANKFLLGVEQITGIPTFPSIATRWHFEDKIAQGRIFRALHIPHPKTHIFFRNEDAEEFIEKASYPFVLKLNSGHQSRNVKLIETAESAREHAQHLFGDGAYSIDNPTGGKLHEALRRARRIIAGARGINVDKADPRSELHHGYFLAQDFVGGNEFDTRITVVGNRAYGFRRFNRPGDFRASGSGLIDWDPSKIDTRMVRMAIDYKKLLKAQTVAFDFIVNGSGAPLVLELALSYASWGVNACPGTWVLDETHDRLVWEEGSVRIEDAILRDFLGSLQDGTFPHGS